MPMVHEDDEDDDDWDEEDEDFDSFDNEDEVETIPCPYCREEIAEESQRCPHCEGYISKEDVTSRSQPIWVVVTAFICLTVILIGILAF